MVSGFLAIGRGPTAAREQNTCRYNSLVSHPIASCLSLSRYSVRLQCGTVRLGRITGMARTPKARRWKGHQPRRKDGLRWSYGSRTSRRRPNTLDTSNQQANPVRGSCAPASFGGVTAFTLEEVLWSPPCFRPEEHNVTLPRFLPLMWRATLALWVSMRRARFPAQGDLSRTRGAAHRRAPRTCGEDRRRRSAWNSPVLSKRSDALSNCNAACSTAMPISRTRSAFCSASG